ncbi:Putative competence-damage inducible protein [Eubacteriaceae bacterium CHKCI005]|nr:Putative competence-damage inducible protein [Eubacteriaceae bacterium CHKCI005]
MRAEIISVGTELLLGDILNTDAQYLSRQLAAVGITVHFQSTVGDNPERLKSALSIALSRSDIIITSGGLGPTADDLTCQTICEELGVEQELHEPSLEHIQEFFEKRGREMTENNRKQAMLPKGCVVFPNTEGTAPGCAVAKGNQLIIMLPGPPRELQAMFEKSVKPQLMEMTKQTIVSHTLHIFGMGESAVETTIADLMEGENPTVAPYAKEGEVQLRVTAMAPSQADADTLIYPVMDELRRRLGRAIYGQDVDNLEQVVVEGLTRCDFHIAVAESCTGGLLAKRIVDIPGASKVMECSFITYSDEKKTKLLGVPPKLLKKYTAVSQEAACSMAIGARRAARSDLGVSITGYAGPEGGPNGEPAGSVWIALTDEERIWARHISVAGASRSYVRHVAASHALDMVRLYLVDDVDFMGNCMPLKKKGKNKKFVKCIMPLPVPTGKGPKKKGLQKILPWKGDSAGQVFSKLLFLVALLAFLGSAGWLLYDQVYVPWKANSAYDSLSDLYGDATQVEQPETPWWDVFHLTSQPEPAEDVSTPEGVPDSFAKLYALNPDVKGWVQIENTGLNYPVVQASDNDYYLYKDFYGNYSKYGTPFFDYRNKLDGTDRNIIVYGHRLINGQMFGALENYKTLKYYKNHPMIQMDTLDEENQWKIFSVFYASTREEHAPNFDYLRTDFSSDGDFLTFVDELRERSLYDIPVDVQGDDQIIMLSSCSHIFKDARVVAVGRKVRPDEEATVDVSKATVNEDCLMPEIWYKEHPEVSHP